MKNNCLFIFAIFYFEEKNVERSQPSSCWKLWFCTKKQGQL